MELIQIIVDIAIFGGVALLVVVLVSYLISRTRKEANPVISQVEKVKIVPVQRLVLNKEQSAQRVNYSTFNDNLQPVKYRELKIVRKPSVDSRGVQEFYRDREKRKPTDGYGTRYTILNEQIARPTASKVVNLYP